MLHAVDDALSQTQTRLSVRRCRITAVVASNLQRATCTAPVSVVFTHGILNFNPIPININKLYFPLHCDHRSGMTSLSLLAI